MDQSTSSCSPCLQGRHIPFLTIILGLSRVVYWGVVWIRVALGPYLRAIGRTGRGWLALRPRHPAAQVLRGVERTSGPHYPVAHFRENLLAYVTPSFNTVVIFLIPFDKSISL